MSCPGSFVSAADASLPQQPGSKPRKRGVAVETWLPAGWRYEGKVRTNGATAGSVDRYYYEPRTDRRFRSRTEVLFYVKHGYFKPKKADLAQGQGSPTAPVPQLRFDFDSPPDKVSWSLSKGGEEPSAFLGEVEVPDQVILDWSTAFMEVTAQNPSTMSS